MQVAAVLGCPIDHSLSPVLHEAAYHCLGFPEWEYSRMVCTAEQLPRIVQQAASDIRGFSVTMPGKEAALSVATNVSERAQLVGSANTLVRCGDTWFADCTDIDGAQAAIAEAGVSTGSALIIGAGGTARPYLAACKNTGFDKVDIASRSYQRAQRTLRVGDQLHLKNKWIDLADTRQLIEAVKHAELVISTLPADSAAQYSVQLSEAFRYIDVTYAPWPTTVAQNVLDRGGVVVSGYTMLLYQAVTQVEYFTGKIVDAEVLQAMADALNEK